MAHCQPSWCSPARLPQYPLQGFHQYRSSTSRTPDEEAFVESLRKYPISPNRSRSADLIERMLSYTYSKNSARHSNTRSAKSLPSKEAVRNLHLHADEIPTRDNDGASKDLKPNFGYKRDVELIPVPTTSRKSKYDEIGMYDYLKSNHKEKKLKGSEVRYLTNVKQCLKERLRQICDEEPVAICPKIQNRYSQHRKKYHRTDGSLKSQKVNYCKNMEKCTDCQDDLTQASTHDEIETSPSTSRDHKESKVNRSFLSFTRSKACYCDKPGPCDCSAQSRSILKTKTPPDYIGSDSHKHRQCISICEHECNKAKDNYINKLKEVILSWSEELPVYANFSSADATKREEVINRLIDTLSQLHKDHTYFEKLEDEIKKTIKVLPMWRPENKENQESFENQLALGLVQKLKGVIGEKNELKDEISKWVDSLPFTRRSVDREAIVKQFIDKLEPITQTTLNDSNYKNILQREVASILNDLPIELTGSKTTIINDMADKLVETLLTLPFAQPTQPEQLDIKSVVLDWIKDISDISGRINLSDDDVLVNDLIMRLNNIKNADIGNSQEQMNDVINNWFNSIEEKKKCQIDHDTKNQMKARLLDKISNSRKKSLPKENIKNLVQKWFDDIQDDLGVSFMDNKGDLDILVTKLKNIQNINNNESRQNTMRQEIVKWLQNLQGRLSRRIESGIQENLVNKLISMIEGDEINNLSVNGLITQNIWSWLQSQPEFKPDKSPEYKDMVIQLSGKLQSLKDTKGELTENDIKTEVSSWIEKLSKERGIHIEPNKQKTLQDTLLSVIHPVQRRKNWDKSNNINEIISKEVSNIINGFTMPIDDKRKLKEHIIQSINQDWNDIQSTDNNEPIAKINNILRHATNLSETQANNLAHTLIKNIKNATFSNLGGTTLEEPLTFDNTLKDKLKSKVEDYLKILPLKSRQHVIDFITDTLIKNFEDPQSDCGFGVIYNELKNSNLSDGEAQEATNKILEMSHQFRHELTNTMNQSPTYGSVESLWIQKQMFMQRLEKEITDFMEKVLNESSSFYRGTTSEGLEESFESQYNKFKYPLKTSTPTKSESGRDLNIEDQYKSQIKDIIKNWIASLQIDISDESFKEYMANDIASDIIDRERYIQLSQAIRSSQDEIEHLKYQVFKWTSKLPNPIDLSTKTAEIKKLLESLKVLDIPNLIRDSSKIHDPHNITQNTDEIILKNMNVAIWKWLSETTTLEFRNSQDRRVIDGLISELSKKLKNILNSDLTTQEANVEELCKGEIANYLNSINDHLEKAGKQRIERKASELINYLKSLDLFSSTLKQYQDISRETARTLSKKDAIKKAIRTWCQKLPLKKGKTYDDMKDIVDNLADAVSRYLLITDTENVNIFMEEILNNLKKLPLQFDKEDSKHLPEFTERLIETLKGVLNDSENYFNNIEDESRKPFLKKAAEVMYDNIENWCKNLPLNLGSTIEDNEQLNLIKQNLAGKLLKKVGELNLDPEIFNDDYLYEDVLKDEVENILRGLVKTKEFEEILPQLKDKLIRDILEAKKEMKNEMAGFAYKQQLRDAISKTLSSIGLPISEETPFEILKENLADAFINLHYVADDEELKRKFKDKIFNEVNKFCSNYLKQHPSLRLNAHQLNEELYKALKKVPVPKEESMRREVEQIRVKDIVADWFRSLPFSETPSDIQKNKLISILAKRLHEIENEAELNPDLDIDETMNHEISKWLKKIKFSSDDESNAESLKKVLIDKLKATKNFRKFDETTVRKSLNYEDLTSDLEVASHYPPSSLSPEDRAHLQRIKDRTQMNRPSLKPEEKKDASVSPEPVATGVQTEEKIPDNIIFQKISQNASIQTIIREAEPPTSLTPQVIVKEYYWNTHGSPTMQGSGSILSGTQSPTQQAGNIQQKTIQETSQVTTASQTKPAPVSKATITQEASIGQVVRSNIQNDTATTTSQQQISNEIHVKSGTSHYNPDDYLQLHVGKRAQIKSCQPCQGRALSGDFNDSPEAGTSKALQQARSSVEQMGQHAQQETDFHESGPEFWSTRYRRNCLDDQNHLNQPCLRHPVCQTPTKDVECRSKSKRKSQQPCTCRKPLLTKCTIRPQSPCQHSHLSNKSCYVSRKHCPKCWDGFCPHPSYLYFRQD